MDETPLTGYVIRTAEGNAAIRVPSLPDKAAMQRAIDELLGPVYEDRQ